MQNPFSPTPADEVAAMVACVQPGERFCDLGSGDGRLLVAALERGAAAAIGFERDEELARKSAALHRGGGVRVCDYWEQDWSGFDVICAVLNGAEQEQAALDKFTRECRSGARLVFSGARIMPHA